MSIIVLVRVRKDEVYSNGISVIKFIIIMGAGMIFIYAFMLLSIYISSETTFSFIASMFVSFLMSGSILLVATVIVTIYGYRKRIKKEEEKK
jgi:biotin transporter BioY